MILRWENSSPEIYQNFFVGTEFLEFLKKNQDSGDLRVGKNQFVYLKNSKNEIFI
jgi:hypothetical protein